MRLWCLGGFGYCVLLFVLLLVLVCSVLLECCWFDAWVWCVMIGLCLFCVVCSYCLLVLIRLVLFRSWVFVSLCLGVFVLLAYLFLVFSVF